MDKFLWGAASAAYQVEGGYKDDGKALSVWDVFTKKKGTIYDGTNADISCDSYHLFDDDLLLLKELGVNSYRFSISWPRVLPDINGELNEKGIKYYEDMIDKLNKNNIEPIVTLYHWDMPQDLENKGGFLNPLFPKWFETYVNKVVTRLKGKVKYYITINEPQCIIGQGLVTGDHAPGRKLSTKDALVAIHHLLMCHGLGMRMIKSIDPKALVSFASTGTIFIPMDKESEEKAYDYTFSVSKQYPWFSISMYLDPIYFGDYPKEYYEAFKDELPPFESEDFNIIHCPPDFLSQNIYTGMLIKNGELADYKKEGIKTADIPWEQIIPSSLYYGPKFLYERYHRPLIISENGMCDNTEMSLDCEIHDKRRCDYLNSYIDQLMKAKDEGVDVKGYMEWSLCDNFEWAWGFSKRFGLVYVPFPSTKRIKKDSFYEYQKIIKKYM